MKHETQNKPQGQAVMAEFAGKHGLDQGTMVNALIDTIFPQGNNPPNRSQVFALCIVAQKYDLDPFLKQIYAFPAKGGGIIPIVSVDGWYALMNKNPHYDGCTAELILADNGRVVGCKATVHRKDRAHPIEVTELVSECSTGSGPWTKSPGRMIRHRAICQAARIAFSLSGIYDPDEAEAIRDAEFSVSGSAPTAPSKGAEDINAAIRERSGEVDPGPAQEPPREVEPEPETIIDEFGEEVSFAVGDVETEVK